MISEKYKQQLVSMQKKKAFSEKNKNIEAIKNFIRDNCPASVLDFGCAHGELISCLKENFPSINFEGYDPGVDEYNTFPNKRYDCLVCNDVIEHIEPEYLDTTLNSINELFSNQCWLIIACYPAKKLLPDGRNAHLTVQTPEWWIDKICKTMTKSRIISNEVVVKNPESDIRDKRTKRIVVPKGQQKELRIILSKWDH